MRTALFAAAALALALPLSARDTAPSSSEAVGQTKPAAPAPSEIVAAAPKADWVTIPADDLLVMTLAPDAGGKPRTVVIQLMPAPFSQGWVHNIRLFARAKWYDGISVNRVQDNYVTQWGDPNYDNPEATGTPKPLPEGVKVMGEDEYIARNEWFCLADSAAASCQPEVFVPNQISLKLDNYADGIGFLNGFPVATNGGTARPRLKFPGPKLVRDFKNYSEVWPVHCYGMVGVGRNYSPDTGSGAELYTVIGHAPRHLDRNIALVGRVIEGMEHLSSLPRGSGALGFYTAEEAGKRTPILTVRVASDLPPGEQPAFEYLSTESETFARYAEAIANRRDPFFIVPAGGADICNIKVPVRRPAP